MNERSRRILNRALGLIKGYRHGTVSLVSLVNGLEGSLNALEEKLPEDFLAQWYSHWGALEEVLAGGREREQLAETFQEAEALERLLLDAQAR